MIKKAGRPPTHPTLKKVAISVRLPQYIVDWLDSQTNTNRAILIEGALKMAYQIDTPKIGEKNET